MLQGFHLAPSLFLSCLHNTRLKPMHVFIHRTPLDGVPVKVCVRSCTNRKIRRHLLCFFSRLVKLSCDERPKGSLLAFAPSDVVASAYRFRNSTRICSIAEQRSLAPSSFTRTTIV
jgi:hypothetical protein